jgi:uncharacterized membrane protein HdeD (DUF308 family)
MKKSWLIIMGIICIIMSLILFYDYYASQIIVQLLASIFFFDVTGIFTYIFDWLANLIILIVGIVLINRGFNKPK